MRPFLLLVIDNNLRRAGNVISGTGFPGTWRNRAYFAHISLIKIDSFNMLCRGLDTLLIYLSYSVQVCSSQFFVSRSTRSLQTLGKRIIFSFKIKLSLRKFIFQKYDTWRCHFLPYFLAESNDSGVKQFVSDWILQKGC